MSDDSNPHNAKSKNSKGFFSHLRENLRQPQRSNRARTPPNPEPFYLSSHSASSLRANVARGSEETPATASSTNNPKINSEPPRLTDSSVAPLTSLPIDKSTGVLETLNKDAHVAEMEESAQIASTTVDLNEARQVQDPVWIALQTSLEMLRDSLDENSPLVPTIETLLLCLPRLEAWGRAEREYEELTRETTNASDSFRELVTVEKISLFPDNLSHSLLNLINKHLEEIKSRLESNGGDTEENSGEDQIVYYYRGVRDTFVKLEDNGRDILHKSLNNSRLGWLNHIEEAPFDALFGTEQVRRGCTEGTRTEVLSGLETWLFDPTSPGVYWMDGMPGIGKTAIAYTFCERMKRRRCLGASFFCDRNSEKCRDATRIIPTIAYQLALYSASFRSALFDVLGSNPEAASKTLTKQFDLLLNKPLQQAKGTMPKQVVIVIDALDECDNLDSIEGLLDLLLPESSGPGIPLKFLVTARPGGDIFVRMSLGVENQKAVAIHLHDISKAQVQADIKLHVKHQLRFVKSIEDSEIDQFVQRCGVLFLTAVSLLQFAAGETGYSKESFMSLIQNTPILTTLHTPIAKMYMDVLKSVLDDEGLEEDEVEDIRLVLNTVLLAQESVNVETIGMLAGIDEPRRVEHALLSLRSALNYSETSGLVSPLDSTFPEVMFDKSKSGSYHCDVTEQGHLLAQGCLAKMKEELRFNMCELDSSFIPDKEVKDIDSIIKAKISPSLGYACRHWADHLESTPNVANMLPLLGEFLFEQLLYWMEALNLLQELTSGVASLLKLKQRLHGVACPPELTALLDDAYAFVQKLSASSISYSTPHIYISSLQLCPRSSLVYRIYSKRIQSWLKPHEGPTERLDMKTSAHQSWNIGSGVLSISYSLDGTRFAAGCENGTVAICDARDGSLLFHPLEGHTDWVRSVAFSPDGTLVLSASSDCTIRLWDVATGQPVPTSFDGHTHPVKSVAFSPSGKRFVSGSWDNTVCVWNTDGSSSTIMEGHKWGVNCVAFSPDDTSVASGANDFTIQVWDLTNEAPTPSTLQGHTNSVMSIAFTPDGTRLISGSTDCTICVWSTDSKSLLSRFLQGCTHFVYSVAVSPDGSCIASGSADSTIRVWSINTGSLITGPWEHFNGVRALAFSPDGTRLLSGSHSEDIKVWNLDEKPKPADMRPYAGLYNKSFQKAFLEKALNEKMIRIRELHDEKLPLLPFQRQTPDSAMSIAWLLESTHLAYINEPLGATPTPELEHQPPHMPNGWKWQSDGWLLNDKSQLLVWVPPDSGSCHLLGHTVNNSRAISFLSQNEDFIGRRWPGKKEMPVGARRQW
ncbi:WD40 repeat-like protein, partial [Rhizoctonia solani]